MVVSGELSLGSRAAGLLAELAAVACSWESGWMTVDLRRSESSKRPARHRFCSQSGSVNMRALLLASTSHFAISRERLWPRLQRRHLKKRVLAAGDDAKADENGCEVCTVVDDAQGRQACIGHWAEREHARAMRMNEASALLAIDRPLTRSGCG